jgi:probable HAF family extracellular repeat protein
MKRYALALTAAVLFSVSIDGHPRSLEYTIVDLGTLPGDTFSNALNVNDRGQVVGLSGTADGTMHAVLWDGDAIIDLGTLGAASSAAWGSRAVLWDRGSIVQLLGLLPSGCGFALDINNHGQIVGACHSNPNVVGGDPHGVLWVDGEPIDLGTLPGRPQSGANAINDRGMIVGFSGAGGFDGHAVAWIPNR